MNKPLLFSLGLCAFVGAQSLGKDWDEIGRYFAEGMRQIEQGMEEGIKEFAEEVKPFIAEAYQRTATLSEQMKKMAESVAENIKKYAEVPGVLQLKELKEEEKEVILSFCLKDSIDPAKIISHKWHNGLNVELPQDDSKVIITVEETILQINYAIEKCNSDKSNCSYISKNRFITTLPAQPDFAQSPHVSYSKEQQMLTLRLPKSEAKKMPINITIE